MNFDEAYEEWKRNKLKGEIYKIPREWGLDESIFENSTHQRIQRIFLSSSNEWGKLLDDPANRAAILKQINH